MSEWLDLELSHHLAPVAAPEGLWDRVQSGPAHVDSPGGLSHWAIAAILTLTAAAGVLWLAAPRRQPAFNPEPFATHSTDPRAISAWMRQAGIDVTLPARSTCKTRGQSTVASANPNHPEAACLLCHT